MKMQFSVSSIWCIIGLCYDSICIETIERAKKNNFKFNVDLTECFNLVE